METAAEPLSESVTLVIKSPNQKQEDLLIEAQRSWSVQQLKAHLQQVFPGQPLEHEQKLIYSGKLLPGHLQLKDILSKETRHVLHIVCNSNLSKMQLPNISEAKQLLTDNSGRIQESVNHPSDGVRQRILPQNLQGSNARFTSTQPQLQGMGPVFPAYTAYSPQQLFWFQQQMYARQYYMQYLAAAAATLATSPSERAQEIPMVPAAAPQALPNPFPADNQPVNPDAPPPVNPGANQNLRMNAQGGLVDEEEINRDWLDWVYTAARFSIFLSILYFYSSLSRFMMVMGAMILMYLHHAGWFLFQRRLVQPIANNPPPAAAAPNQDQNNNLQNENASEDHETETSNERPATSETRLPSPTFIKTAWVFFKTFFASLIPEGPPGIIN
ncbi:homocysteine-responsive endoplasmic reticulum-resident ubiquitin-like domain member 1 protein isoform X2 [Microcaecilia unicolor]|uniref:Homocysteine-responsive endoplasmic reticulum-resident ubiquitin-like domain member 2 protein n=1 Tax=Microcaecilia unicolor TaxID=1415580 RepID=A0A6P7Y915_9AMPH|nr:homocysteine-responsive endoplasmic reticulum-resident ubiquitin-like domain member 1 protein isoform X2 [Microcaecilia unicolor]